MLLELILMTALQAPIMMKYEDMFWNTYTEDRVSYDSENLPVRWYRNIRTNSETGEKQVGEWKPPIITFRIGKGDSILHEQTDDLVNSFKPTD